MAEQNTNQIPVANPALVTAMEHMKQERKAEHEAEFAAVVKDARFIAPVLVDAENQAQNQVAFYLIKNQKGEKYLPVFTDMEEYKKWNHAEQTQLCAAPFMHLCQLWTRPSKAEAIGIVINPFSHNIMIPGETIIRIGMKKAMEDLAAARNAIAAAPEDEKAKAQGMQAERVFIDTFKASRLFIPANVTTVPQASANADGTISLQDQQKVGLVVFNNPDGKKFFPIFTDSGEYRKWDQFDKQRLAAFTFQDFCKFVQDPSTESDGVVLNPYSDNLIVPKDALLRMNNTATISPGTKIKIGSLKEEPTALLDAMRAYLTGQAAVNKAYLRVMQREDRDKPNYLLVVDVDPSLEGLAQKQVFDALAESAKPHLGGMELAIAPTTSNFGQAALKDAVPFYEK